MRRDKTYLYIYVYLCFSLSNETNACNGSDNRVINSRTDGDDVSSVRTQTSLQRVITSDAALYYNIHLREYHETDRDPVPTPLAEMEGCVDCFTSTDHEKLISIPFRVDEKQYRSVAGRISAGFYTYIRKNNI